MDSFNRDTTNYIRKKASKAWGKKGTKPYESGATVVSAGDNPMVLVDGMKEPMEANVFMDSKRGDRVRVSVSNSGVNVIGNKSNPATDNTVANRADTFAKRAYKMADDVTERVDGAYDKANDALQTATTANSMAVEAKEVAEGIRVTTAFYIITQSDEAPERPTDDTIATWASVPFSFSNSADDYQWMTVRTAFHDSVTYTDPVLEPGFAAAKAAWLAEYRDSTVWAYLPVGEEPGEDSWNETRPERSDYADGMVLWTATMRSYNDDTDVLFGIVPYSGAVSSVTFYYEEVGEDAPDAPVGFLPAEESGWRSYPPPVPPSVSETDKVWSCTRTLYGDGTFTWGDVRDDSFYTSFVSNAYQLESIKGAVGEMGESFSTIQQTADEIMLSVQGKEYVEVGGSGISQLSSAMMLDGEKLTIGFSDDTGTIGSMVSSMEFNADGMSYTYNNVSLAKYGAEIVLGDEGSRHMTISTGGWELFNGINNEPVAMVEDSAFSIGEAKVRDRLVIDNPSAGSSFYWYQRSNGNLTLKAIGGAA